MQIAGLLIAKLRRSAPAAIALLSALGCAPSPEPASVAAVTSSSTPATLSPAASQENPSTMSPASAPAVYQVLGAEIEIQLVLDRPAILLSEPTYAKVIVKNRSALPLTMQASWMGRNGLGRPENYTLGATDAGGKAVPSPDAGPQMGGQSWEVALTPDKSFEARLFLPSWAPFTAPGSYTIALRTTLPFRRDTDSPWTELAVTAQAVLTVLPDDSAKLGQIIESTAARVKPGENEPIQILSAIRDPRVVPHFAALLRSNDYTQKFHAIRALGTWNDERALSALEDAMATQAKDLDAKGYTTESLREQSAQQLRLAVAQSLSESPHPRALDLLLKMKADSYSGVRLTVVHKAAKIDPAVGRPLLTAMAKDPDAMVRGEAKRYLGEKK